MRKVREMVDFCEEQGFMGNYRRSRVEKNFLVLKRALLENEEVLMCFVAIHGYISPTKHHGDCAYAITNQRIIIAQHRIFNESAIAVLLDQLNDISFSNGAFMGTIVIDTMKECITATTGSETAARIYAMAHELLIKLKKQSKAVPQAPSTADELIKFKALLDSGAITQDEFEQLKKSLLKK